MISIIIPAHNEYTNLQRLFNVANFIGHPKLKEVIIAASPASNDATQALAQKYGITFLSCEKKGRATQMNTAAQKAAGDILVFLHADVIPPNNFLDDIYQCLNDNFDAGFFSYKFDKESWLLRLNSSFTAKDGLFTGGGDQCLFIRKSTFDEIGKFNENQVLMEDFEFFGRMKKNKVPYKIIKNDLIVSARKYDCNSYLRINLSNLLLVVLFKLGYPGEKLKTLHNKLIRTPYTHG